MDTIILVNRSTVLSDERVMNIIPALQTQVSHDFAPIWGVDGQLGFRSMAEDVAAAANPAWRLMILDRTDIEGAGGYHVDQHGRISGKVFAADAIDAGEEWTIDASHELLEMLADPTAGTDPSKFVDLRGHWAGSQCLREVCDAVESDALGYSHPGADGKPVLLSDFVTPEYFYENAPSSVLRGVFDFMNHLHAPAPALLQGGYLGIRGPDGQWSQVSNFAANGRRSRRSMRHGRTAWAAAACPHA